MNVPRSIAAVVCVVAASCAGSDPDSTSNGGTTSTPAPVESAVSTDVEAAASAGSATTAAPSVVVAPLTGREAAIDRGALVVKIDNHDRARPQFGINQADVVFEEIVEGGITRLAAVFHSEDADQVGPVRSVRTSDFDLLSNLQRPLFANSGGNQVVLDMLRAVDIVDISANVSPDSYSRLADRDSPHNLVTSTDELWALDRDRAGRPEPLFTYHESDAPPSDQSVEAIGVVIDFGTNTVEFRWDDATAGWERSQNDAPHLDAEGVVVAPANVVVQFISYRRSPASSASPEAVVVGTGEVWVYTGGRRIVGTWERATSADRTTLRDLDGNEITLAVGRTWVELARVGLATDLAE